MSEVTTRIENPSPGVRVQKLHIPDDANFGTGTFIAVLNKDVLMPVVEPGQKVIETTAENPPRFRLFFGVNPGTGEICVLLGRADGTPPVSDNTFVLPSGTAASEEHQFKVVFRNWRLLSLQMDGQCVEPNVQDPRLDRLAAFVGAYSEAVGRIASSGVSTLFPLHAEDIEHVDIIGASDGFFVAYHPHHESSRGDAGVVGWDMFDYDLNTVCQWLTAGMLRVRHVQLGKRYEPPTPVPDAHFGDEFVPGNRGIMLHPEVRGYLKSTLVDRSAAVPLLPAVHVSPFIDYDRGIAREVVPGRFKLWSPVVEVPGLGLRRMYHFTHADLWWYPDRLNLDLAEASCLAQLDLQAFDAVVRSVPIFTPEEAGEDVPQHAWQFLTSYCDEFEGLLESAGGDEEQLHQWLKQPAHHIFLDPDPDEVWSKLRFGKNYSDFVVRCSDGRYKLIEIERANLRVFQKKGHEPTAAFNHACGQVRDWKQHVREHVHEVREVQGLTGIYEPAGVVVMGRTRDIDSADAQRRWDNMKADFEPQVFTYDEICERVRRLASRLRDLGTKL